MEGSGRINSWAACKLGGEMSSRKGSMWSFAIKTILERDFFFIAHWSPRVPNRRKDLSSGLLVHAFSRLAWVTHVCPSPSSHTALFLQVTLLASWVSPWVWGCVSMNWGPWKEIPATSRGGRSLLNFLSSLMFPPPLLQNTRLPATTPQNLA